MVRNTYRSRAGRSAIARRAIMAPGTSNGFLPQNPVTALLPNGSTRVIGNAMFFGGDKKGGLPPMATGFYIPSSSSVSNRPLGNNQNSNFLFTMRTQNGLGPRGLPNIGRVI